MSARATLADSPDGQVLILRCPGCEDNHQVHVGRWSWNGDLERVTLSPSLLVGGVQWDTEKYLDFQTARTRRDRHPDVPVGGRIVCHSFVVDGRIQFLGDSTHVLSGQTVDLPEWSP